MPTMESVSPKRDNPDKRKSEDLRARDFSFAADDVVRVLRKRSRSDLLYVGSACSHFQAEPLVLDPRGDPIITSDWEMEVVKNIEGKPSKISGSQHPEEFPHFLKKKSSYVARSTAIGENMFRLSLDFARLCPSQNEFNMLLMSDYVRTLAQIRACGLEPMLAIYHWPMPKYLLNLDHHAHVIAGGWEHPEASKHFRFYVDNVLAYLENDDKVRSALEMEGLGKKMQDKFLSEGLVHYFLTINEPSVVLMNGYMFGAFPPYKKGNISAIRTVLGQLVGAHEFAFDAIKQSTLKSGRESKIGVANNWTYFDGMLGRALHKILDEKITKLFEKTGENTDFVGLQYYCRMTVPSLYRPIGPMQKKGRHYGDHPSFGDIYPLGIFEVLKQMHQLYPNKEIFITEFGFSDKEDIRRPYWILETVRYVIEAIKVGIPIKGILLWSLANNFEWELGMSQKFGLFDELDLEKPLQQSQGNKIRGWEAWRATANAIRNPSSETIAELQTCYERASRQFEQTTTQRH